MRLIIAILINFGLWAPVPQSEMPRGLPANDWTISSDTVKKPHLFSQCHNLEKALKKYEAIQSRGGWPAIATKKDSVWKPGSRSRTITSVRTRLFLEGFLSDDNASDVFDDALLAALNHYKKTHNMAEDGLINRGMITSLNVPVSDRIQTIRTNMERCRLVEADEDGEFIAVNIPSFTLYYFIDGKPALSSRVVVGKEATKTVVFNDTISSIVFAPYWYIPESIARKELYPALRKNPKLFSQMQLEWHNKKLRQKPGKNNSLGLVKFVFPNSNDIYLHDTPLKSLFKEKKRTFSHGCIRVEYACELAAMIMQRELGWTEAQTVQAMNAGEQFEYTLKNQIPIFIAYFTAWADEEGIATFFPDVYQIDEKPALGDLPEKLIRNR